MAGVGVAFEGYLGKFKWYIINIYISCEICMVWYFHKFMLWWL